MEGIIVCLRLRWGSTNELGVSQWLNIVLEQSGMTYSSRALIDRFCRHVDRPHHNHTASTRSLRPAPDTSDLSTWWWEWHSGFNILRDPASESWSVLFRWVLSPFFEPCIHVFDPCAINSRISFVLLALLATSRSSISTSALVFVTNRPAATTHFQVQADTNMAKKSSKIQPKWPSVTNLDKAALPAITTNQPASNTQTNVQASATCHSFF